VSQATILEAIRTIATKLGRAPKVADLEAYSGITRPEFRRCFPSMRQAVRRAGLEPDLQKVRNSTADMMEDYGQIARKMGRAPSSKHYAAAGKFSPCSFYKRFGTWKKMPERFRHYVLEGGDTRQEQWRDVLEMVNKRIAAVDRAQAEAQSQSGANGKTKAVSTPAEPGEYLRRRSPIFPERPVFGAPMPAPGLAYEPVNEMGVVLMFGIEMHRLGFHVERMQPDFPDCEAMREVQPGVWQRVRVEFEYESRNFLRHGHKASECDVIICWRHNWPECPVNLDVVELCRVVSKG
jgi:Homing endonuclease associated repeat